MSEIRPSEWEWLSESKCLSDWDQVSDWVSGMRVSEWVRVTECVRASEWLSGCEWVSGMRVSATASEWLRASEMSERANAWECERASVSDWVRENKWLSGWERASERMECEWVTESERVRESKWMSGWERASEWVWVRVSERTNERERAIARECKRASETDWAAWSKRVSEWNASECECEQMSENESKSVSGMGTSEWARGIEQMSECERVRMQVVTECVWEQVTEWLRANEWVNGMRVRANVSERVSENESKWVSANVSECVRARASKWVSTNASEWMGAIEQISESDRVRMRTSESDWVWESKWLVRG